MKPERIETHCWPGYYEVQVLGYKNGNTHYRLTYKPNSMQLGCINKEYVPHSVSAMNADAARVQLLAKALREARDAMLHWQGYASDYFKDKHDADGDIAAIDAALTEAGLNEQKEG